MAKYIISYLQLGIQILTILAICFLCVTSYEIFSVTQTSWIHKNSVVFVSLLLWMRQNLILILYFLSLAILILLLGPGFLLSVVQLMQLIKEINGHIWMPHSANQNPLVWNTLDDDGFDEIQHFNCLWTITTNNENFTVNIIYLMRTFTHDFWIRAEINPQGNPKASQLLDTDDLHPLFKFSSNSTAGLLQISRTSLKRVSTSRLWWINGPPVLQSWMN